MDRIRLQKKLDQQRGSALIVAVMIAVLVSLVAIGYLEVSAGTFNNENQSEIDCKAFNAAESGARLGKVWLDSNYTLTTNMVTGYDTAILSNLQINNLTVHVDIIKLDSGVTIKGTALTSGPLGYNKVVTIKAVKAANVTYPFMYGVFGSDSIIMSGNAKIDGYDSRLGAYGGKNVDSAGNIATNGTKAGVIKLSGSSVVAGNAGTGVNGTVTLGGTSHITGTVSHNTAATIAPVSVPFALKDLTSGGAITTNKTLTTGSYKYSSITLSGGNSCFDTIIGNVNLYITGNISLANSAKITITSGSTLTLFVDGTVNLGGAGLFNMSSIPGNAIIESTYSGANGVTINNGSSLYCAVYAPQTQVNLTGSGALFTSLVAKAVIANNSAVIHYDISLQGTSVSTNGSAGGVVNIFAGSWSVQNTVQ